MTGRRALLALLAVAAASCGGERVKGSGITETRSFDLGSFVAVVVEGPFTVSVTVAAEQEVSVTVDDNVWEHVEASVHQGVLRIGLAEGVSVIDATLEATVATPVLHAVSAVGASRVDLWTGKAEEPVTLIAEGASTLVGGVDAPLLTMRLSGASQATITGEATDLRLIAEGASRAELGELEAETATISMSGASSGEAWVTDRVSSVRLSGASELTLWGDPEIGEREIAGASTLSGG